MNGGRKKCLIYSSSVKYKCAFSECLSTKYRLFVKYALIEMFPLNVMSVK